MLEDEISLVLNGVSSERYRLSVVDRPLVPSPMIQYKEHEVLGSYGDIVQRFGYQDIQYTIVLNYLETVDKGTFKRNFREIRRWLYEGTILQFTDEPEVSYQVKKVEIGEADNDIIEYGKFTVKFTLGPFGKLAEKAPLVFTKTVSKETFSFSNQSLYPNSPLIHLYGFGDCSLYLNEDEPIQFKGITTDIIVDCERKLTYRYHGKLLVNESSKQSSNDYPTLDTGVNTMILDGKEITKLEIWRNELV